MNIQKIGVGDTKLFARQVFDILPGVSYVYGLNQSGRSRTLNGNASGKSFFFGRIRELLYDDPVVGVKQDKHRRGKAFVQFTRKKTEVRVASAFSGRTEAFSITLDGTKHTYNTPTKAKPEIAKIWGLTADEFDSYVYLDSRVPHPLVRGSSTERKRFFTSFFGLDRIDAEKKLFLKEMQEFKRVRAALTELATSHADLSKDLLTPEQVRELKAEYLELKQKVDELAEAENEAQRVKLLLEFEQSSPRFIQAVHKYAPGLTEEELQAAVVQAEELVAKYRKRVRAAERWAEYAQQLEVYERKVGKYKSLNAEDYAEPHAAYLKALPKLEALIEELEDLPEIERPAKVAKVVVDEEHHHKLHRLKADLRMALKFKQGVCGECGQPVKTKNKAALQQQIEELESNIEAANAYAKYAQQAAKYSEAKEKRNALATKIAEAQAVVDECKKGWQIYEVLSKVQKPMEPDGTALELDQEETKLEKAQARLDLLRTSTSHFDMVCELAKLTPQQRKLKASKDLAKFRERLTSIKTKMAVHRAVKDKVVTQRERIDVLEKQLKEEEALKILVKGYSDKAIKRMAVEAISARLIQLINHYAQSVFPGYMFDFQWERQISILVHRPNGEVSDVRKLSGAESMLFTLILIPALLAFMPAHKRTNVLILDEPSASFSEATMQTFHDLLPVLQKLVPSIIVITPKAQERYAGAHEFTVHRTKSGAVIKPGHPEVHV